MHAPSSPLVVVLTVACTLTVAACGPAAGSDARGVAARRGDARGATTPANADYVRLKLITLYDEQGFGRPVEAFRVLVPADWRVEGGVQWPSSHCRETMVVSTLRATSPDGAVGIAIYPDSYWEWIDEPLSRQRQAERAAQTGGCAVAPPLDAVGFMRRILLPELQLDPRGAEITTAPALARERLATVSPDASALVRAGVILGFDVSAARARLRAPGVQAGAEQQLTVTVTHGLTAVPDMGAAMRGVMANTHGHTFHVNDVALTRYPAGTRERWAPVFATILASVQVSSAWQHAVKQVQRNIQRVELNEVQRQQAMWSEYQQWSRDLWSRTSAERDAVQARMSDEWGQTIRGVERFVDDSRGERVELTAGYRDAWTNGKGEFILSSDPNFDPRVTLQEDWRAMARESDRPRP